MAIIKCEIFVRSLLILLFSFNLIGVNYKKLMRKDIGLEKQSSKTKLKSQVDMLILGK